MFISKPVDTQKNFSLQSAIRKVVINVLGSAGIGLIFTRSQEGTQQGRLTQTGQLAYSLLCAMMLGAGWRSWPGEVNHGLGVRWALGGETVALCIPLFLYIGLISIVVVAVRFLCRSVKLPLSRPTSFPFFCNSPPHPSEGRGDGVTTWSFVDGWAQPNHNSLFAPNMEPKRQG